MIAFFLVSMQGKEKESKLEETYSLQKSVFNAVRKNIL